MRSPSRFYLSCFLLFLYSFSALMAQEAGVPEDNVFRLLQADRAQQTELYGVNYRIVQGNAKFLHNNTFFFCDSASWNVDGRIIEAFGNVQLVQDRTILTSENMTYVIDENVAKFRGNVVELVDKDGNTLRTSQLDYNTKDSVGTFAFGGAVRDSSGNVIESQEGIYDSKESMFTFENQVELYMDSIELRTTQLRYLTSESKALFGIGTYMWRGDGFMKCDNGSYSRESEVSQFADNVYLNNPQYEAWTDEAYYYQKSGKVDMYRKSQILDTLHKSYYLADRIEYIPSPDDTLELWKDKVNMTENPVIVYCGENENHQADTLYFRGDTISIHSRLRCDVSQDEIDEGKKLVSDMEYDALIKARSDLAAERERRRQESLREAGLLPPGGLLQGESQEESGSDSAPANPGAEGAAANTVPAATMDTAAVMPVMDTTPVRFITSFRNVRIFRSDVQACCDSISFNEVDSVARLFGKPIMWNAVKNQMTSEMMYLLMKNGNLHRGSMQTDAWVISQEDSIHFHQIKSAEMLGYFYENQLYRFDALGGANAVFYLAENDVVSTINIKESRSLTAMIKDGNAKRLLYMESIKSDAYPISELVLEKQRLKGFEWRSGERPESRESITEEKLHTTSRDAYINIARPTYPEVNKYFDNYMVGKTVGNEEIQIREDVPTSVEILEMRP